MKPHEETWTWNQERGRILVADADDYDFGAEVVVTDHGAYPPYPGRRELIVQAPAMARLLLCLAAMDVQAADDGRTIGYACQWCGAETRTEDPMTPDEAQACVEHMHDCRLVAVLKAAGVMA